MTALTALTASEVSQIVIAFLTFGVLLVAIKTLINSQKEFHFLNQGYLSYKPNFTLIKEGSKIGGFTFELNLNNTGNLPIRYDFLDIDIFFNGQKRNNFSDYEYPFGILYPKEETKFFMKSVKFDSPIEENDFFKSKMQLNFKIEYKDLSKKNTKIIDRKLESEFLNRTQIKMLHIEYNDKI